MTKIYMFSGKLRSSGRGRYISTMSNGTSRTVTTAWMKQYMFRVEGGGKKYYEQRWGGRLPFVSIQKTNLLHQTEGYHDRKRL
jgi:hypothetical protein